MSGQAPASPDDPEEEPSYEVGYGKPPRATRFQPGRSGNPKGRPKGSRKAPPADVAVEKLKALALQEAYRPIRIKDGEKQAKLPVIQAALRNVTLSAAKGNQRAQRMLFDFVGQFEAERRRDREMLFEAAFEYEQHGKEQIAQARLRGLPEPVLVPHPDHFIINPLAGSVKLRGPLTDEEKVVYDWLAAMSAQIREELAELQAELGRAPRSRKLEKLIEAHRLRIARIDAMLNFERILVKGTH